ncbi:hypothetical protein, partial [Elioraea rosea]|uniref:hypothetical protein n=1 Tax=Elioraea rosea TaxID=2492390 RepID=UPI001951B39F
PGERAAPGHADTRRRTCTPGGDTVPGHARAASAWLTQLPARAGFTEASRKRARRSAIIRRV